jgi:hypothetical protein
MITLSCINLFADTQGPNCSFCGACIVYFKNTNTYYLRLHYGNPGNTICSPRPIVTSILPTTIIPISFSGSAPDCGNYNGTYYYYNLSNYPVIVNAMTSTSIPSLIYQDINYDPLGLHTEFDFLNHLSDVYLSEYCHDDALATNCIGDFNYSFNTADISTDAVFITLNDNDYSYLTSSILDILNNTVTNCEGLNINGPNGCLGIGTKRIKTTDTWIIDNTLFTTTIEYNSIDNPSMYEANKINMNSFSYLAYNFSALEVCHKKKIEIGCYYDYSVGELSHSGNACIELNEFYSYNTVYECNLCQKMCIEMPYINGEVITSDPINKKSNSANKTITSFNFVSIHPNPATNFLNVNLNEKVKEVIELKVTDIQGKVIKTSNYSAKEGQNLIELNVDDLANGLYFLQISSNSNKFTEKFTIKK